MFKRKCDNCGEYYQVKDVRCDEHWRTWSLEPYYCYCPHCNQVIKYMNGDLVELAQKLTPKNILAVFIFFGAWFIGIVTNTLNYIGPVTVIVFGAYLAKTSQLKDHRIIGWLLAIVGGILLIYVNKNA